ncbi:unannotated protein [freshwater metagenome]|uniref:Unannotated protein n=1 Tax=freshwater metagenome TaxID=449393 RepID=A0A6J7J345_9ZZZZ
MLALCCGLASLLLLSAVSSAPAAVWNPTGPLTQFSASSTLNCSVFHSAAGENSSAFAYQHRDGPYACGTFLYDGTKLYGPALGEGFPTRSTFQSLGAQVTAGSGTLNDPYTITTRVRTDSTEGLRIDQVDSYVEGQESVRTDITVRNLGSGVASATLWHAGDCFQARDGGGSTGAGGAVACTGPAGGSPLETVEFFPVSTGSAYIEALYSGVWSAIGARQPLPNTCGCIV